MANFEVLGGSCHCGYSENPDWVGDPPPPPDPAASGFTVSFSKSAVIFEDAHQEYPNRPFVPRRSTETRLTVCASGGLHGGTLSLQTQNLSRLTPRAGTGPLVLPSEIDLVPFQTYYATFICSGVQASDEENDVVVSGMFTGNGTSEVQTSSSLLTVVRVELKAQDPAPWNAVPTRHRYGVFELVDLDHWPEDVVLSWRMVGGGTTDDSTEGFAGSSLGSDYMRCPLYNNGARPEVSFGGAVYRPDVEFVEPSAIQAVNPRAAEGPDRIPRGIVGCAMLLDLYVLPMDVSFTELSVAEIPSDVSTYSGFFQNSYPENRRSHNILGGAGRWISVKSANPGAPQSGMGNFLMTDCATTGLLIGVDEYGEMEWYIPMGWHKRSSREIGSQPFREFAQGLYWHQFRVWPNGDAWVRKHQHELLRHENEGAL